jgi:hypothetical protein
MVPLSKSGRRKPRGFESLPLRRASLYCARMMKSRICKTEKTPSTTERAIRTNPNAVRIRYCRLSALRRRTLSSNASRSSRLNIDVNALGPAIKVTATTAIANWAISHSARKYASEPRREPTVTDNSRAGRGRLVWLRAQTWKVCERKLRGFESHPLRKRWFSSNDS